VRRGESVSGRSAHLPGRFRDAEAVACDIVEYHLGVTSPDEIRYLDKILNRNYSTALRHGSRVRRQKAKQSTSTRSDIKVKESLEVDWIFEPRSAFPVLVLVFRMRGMSHVVTLDGSSRPIKVLRTPSHHFSAPVQFLPGDNASTFHPICTSARFQIFSHVN
jgi:hypothetical protein